MNVGNVGSSSSNLQVPGKHDRSNSGSPSGSDAGERKKANFGWGDLTTLSTPSGSGSPAPRSPAPRSPNASLQSAANVGATSRQHGGEMHAETWHSFYNREFYTGQDQQANAGPENAATPSDASSMAAEWHRIGRPEVQAAFDTLMLYYLPDADEEKINAMARELLLEWHPDKVADNLKDEAQEETKKINDARQVALDYVRGK